MIQRRRVREQSSLIEESIFDKEIYELSRDQANEILRQFLRMEEDEFKKLDRGALAFDYSRESVVRFFDYVLENFFDPTDVKSEINNTWILRLAYYFGESLRRYSNQLHWGLGQQDTALENHPVVKGFADSTEAALITISRNLLVAVAVDGEPRTRISRAVDAWFDATRSQQ